MPWVALKKPPRRAPSPFLRWREAHRDGLTTWLAGGIGLSVLLAFWFVIAQGVAR
jgi:hypothetical protein